MGPAGGDAPRLLDLTRSVSRAGRAMTGVDRVEYAYLDHLLQAGPLFGLVRSSLGYILLDAQGCALLRDRLRDGGWGAPGWLARLKPRVDPMRRRAESDLRRVALARCLPAGLGRMLRRRLPAGTRYINVGHTALTDRLLHAVRKTARMRVAVMIHDLIPLDHPQFQRAGAAARFARFLDRALAQADVILCNSQATEAALRGRGDPRPGQTTVTAHLGVDLPQPGRAPEGPWDGAPFFVALGTIEPRKNHALLLDLWPEIEDAHLLICGARGWNNDAVFARLDARPDRVHELGPLPDAAVFSLLQRSAGLLFPSHAEGYGLPPIEAAALGVPVVCNDLPVYREVLGDIPVYAPVADRYLWRQTINDLAAQHRSGASGPHPFVPPCWKDHFKAVLTVT